MNNFLLNFISLIISNSWSKWVFSQVTANSDSGRLDHGSILRSKRWAVKFGVIHVTDVASTLGVTVILFNDFVHQRSKSSVRIMRAGVDTDSGVDVLTS